MSMLDYWWATCVFAKWKNAIAEDIKLVREMAKKEEVIVE
jgi:hypothetical protein